MGDRSFLYRADGIGSNKECITIYKQRRILDIHKT
jgi:hypothetical protein